jgi:PadR family transcriptional regulator PadR
MSKREATPEILQGTLDLMVLRTLETMGPQHGLGLAKRIEQISDGGLYLNQGTVYPALLRLQQRGWIRSEPGVSDNNRRARYYKLTAAGRRQIHKEEAAWVRVVALMSRFLRAREAE